MRTILFISGGLEAIPGIRRAKQMGLRVVVSDGSPKAPGFAIADESLLASTYDIPATVAAARESHSRQPINGVLCLASDVPLTVATVAHELGLPGIPLEAARIAMDKLAMKSRFARDGVRIPWYAPVRDVEALREIAHKQGFPLVLKPVDSRGARGVLRLTDAVDVEWAFEFSRRESPTGRVMAERFLSGPQVSTESLVVDGTVHTPGFSDRNYEFLEKYAPHIIENGGDLPSCLPESEQKAVRELVVAAVASLGIANGVVKGDIVISEGKPYIIEVATRLSGGYFCTHEIPLNTGVDFVGCSIRLALGEKPTGGELTPRYSHFVCQRYMFPAPGKITAISGVPEAATIPGVEFIDVRGDIGDIIGPIHDHPARAGVVITTGETRQAAQTAATQATQNIIFETRP